MIFSSLVCFKNSSKTSAADCPGFPNRTPYTQWKKHKMRFKRSMQDRATDPAKISMNFPKDFRKALQSNYGPRQPIDRTSWFLTFKFLTFKSCNVLHEHHLPTACNQEQSFHRKLRKMARVPRAGRELSPRNWLKTKKNKWLCWGTSEPYPISTALSGNNQPL